MEDNLVLSEEDSSCPDEGDLELGLGLGVGAYGFKMQQPVSVTGKDVPSNGPSSSPTKSTSSSSSSSLSRANVAAGTKRTADSVAASSAAGQVRGWPPIRAYRMNSMTSHMKSLAPQELKALTEQNRSKNGMRVNNDAGIYRSSCNAKGKASFFVKVNMAGTLIGRKVDLNAHSCYESLAFALEDMFLVPPATIDSMRSRKQEYSGTKERRNPKLLDGSSEFVLTYEDKEGDWMLVGDVPWGMFLSSVKRLRIMKTCEATGVRMDSFHQHGR